LRPPSWSKKNSRAGRGGEKVGRKSVPLACVFCLARKLFRIRTQPVDGEVFRVYECEDCGAGKYTITKETYWQGGHWPKRDISRDRETARRGAPTAAQAASGRTLDGRHGKR